jgi:hypothetical protein
LFGECIDEEFELSKGEGVVCRCKGRSAEQCAKRHLRGCVWSILSGRQVNRILFNIMVQSGRAAVFVGHVDYTRLAERIVLNFESWR